MMKYLLGLVLVFLASFPARAVTNTIIATNAVWKYLDDGSNPGATWTGRGFNDASWAFGPGPFGYGDGDEATVVKFGPDPNNRFITTYFRHSFDLPDPATYAVLLLGVRRDDGVVVYLNGQEVFRSNLPNGTIATNTLATSASDDGDAVQRTTVNPALLVAGTNVIAAEIHQASAGSTDISFDLELRGSTELNANNPPLVSVSNPRPNASYIEPAGILVAASATDADGRITRVEFFEGNTKLGEDATAPFSFIWSPVPAGNYSLRAVATDNIDVKTTSAVVNVTVELSTVPTLT